MVMKAPHIPDRLCEEAAKVSPCVLNKTPSSVLNGKAPLELWIDGPLGSLRHIHGVVLVIDILNTRI